MVQPGVSALGKKNSTTVLPRKSLRETFFPFSSGKVNSGALSLTSMGFSPLRQPLYRSTGRVVILAALALMLGQIGAAQFTRKPTASKGPRALALVELAPSGKARLIPVAILEDGKFYDASAYKASPVPMALESGTVYEGERTGVSQGLFTVAGTLQLKNTWIGDGTWQPSGSVTAKKALAASKPVQENVDAPPKLRRSPEKSKAAEPAASQPAAPEATAQTPATTPAAAPPASAAAPLPPVEEDRDRPVLRRGKQEHPPEKSPAEVPASATRASPAGPRKPSTAGSGGMKIFPAISDAGGPEPLPYTYDLKPEEEQRFRQKMLALAADEVRTRAKLMASETIEPAPPLRTPVRGKAATKPPQPSFDDVQLRVFDLTSNNEPVLVLTATAQMPQRHPSAGPALPYYVALVARNDIYGELHKVLANITDAQHLDVQPRLELIDAVDADGDSRGELLFRQVSDAGSAFVIDRVIGDQLYTLFQGTPQ